jgi:hypothetical protein
MVNCYMMISSSKFGELLLKLIKHGRIRTPMCNQMTVLVIVSSA